MNPFKPYLPEIFQSIRGQRYLSIMSVCAGATILFYFLSLVGGFTENAFAVVNLPGEDAANKMESAGTLMHFIDTGLFRWAARILAGLCVFGAGWNLKEMRFGPAFISLISAILFGTAPTWVKNIFTLGASDSVFSSNSITPVDRPFVNGEESTYV